jgi:hypothetical protein
MKLWDQSETLGVIESQLAEAKSSVLQAKRELEPLQRESPQLPVVRALTQLVLAAEHQQKALMTAKAAIVARATA